MNTRTILVVLVLATLPLAGCVENMRDLKERVEADDPAVTPAAVPSPEVDTVLNNTTQAKPPVARIGVFGANGALVYKATFKADDEPAPVYVEEGATLRLIASDSEALEPGANLTSFVWTFKGERLEGRQVEKAVGEAGLYPVTLTVTDTLGQADAQNITLAVAPKPFDVVTELTVPGPIVGAEGQGQSGSATFDLKLSDAGVPATISAVQFVAKPGATCDAILTVTDAEGETVGSVDDEGAGGAETINGGALAEGAYTITVGPFACAAPDGVPVTVTVTYMPTVEGLAAGDGHGHAH